MSKPDCPFIKCDWQDILLPVETQVILSPGTNEPNPDEAGKLLLYAHNGEWLALGPAEYIEAIARTLNEKMEVRE